MQGVAVQLAWILKEQLYICIVLHVKEIEEIIWYIQCMIW